jgi:hypothetical protein
MPFLILAQAGAGAQFGRLPPQTESPRRGAGAGCWSDLNEEEQVDPDCLRNC